MRRHPLSAPGNHLNARHSPQHWRCIKRLTELWVCTTGRHRSARVSCVESRTLARPLRPRTATAAVKTMTPTASGSSQSNAGAIRVCRFGSRVALLVARTLWCSSTATARRLQGTWVKSSRGTAISLLSRSAVKPTWSTIKAGQTEDRPHHFGLCTLSVIVLIHARLVPRAGRRIMPLELCVIDLCRAGAIGRTSSKDVSARALSPNHVAFSRGFPIAT